MDTSLLDLLKECSTDSKEYTHTSLYGPNKNWTFSDGSYVKFWKRYCEIADSPENNTKRLCLAEIPKSHMPIISDLTLRFHPGKDLTELPYDTDFILAIVYCYQQIIKETLNISEREHELYCCVLKGEPVLEDNLLVCRIRLHFPYCKTMVQIQNRIIRPLVLQMFRSKNVIARLDSQPVNDWEDIVDPLSVEKPVVMYGSSPSPTVPKLILEYIFIKVLEKDIDSSSTHILELSETFYIQNHEHAAKGLIPLEMFLDEDGELDHELWLPYFLSIYYLKEITLPKNVEEPKINHKVVKPINTSNFVDSEDTNSPEYLSSVFLDMLSKKRSEREHYWLDVGKALYNSFDGSERGLEKWIDFTETNDEFTAEQCKDKYYNFVEIKTTIKTLAYYAREDSYESYQKWHKIWYLPYLEKAMSGTHSDVAEAFYRVYWLEFACSNLSKNKTHYFEKNKWRLLDSGHVLKNVINGDFITIIEKYRIEIASHAGKSNDQNFKDSAEVTIQKIGKLIMKLKSRTFKNPLYLEACEKFYIDDFENILDSNPDLMGCTNGVIEVLDKKAVFRDGKPEDYVSKSTGIFWRHDFHKRHPLVLKVITYLGKVFPDKELLNYVGKLLAATLKGRNSEKIFPIHSGKGNNSKSMLKILLECAYGDYAITIPTNVFTGNKSGGPAPEIARSKFAHFAFVQEPDAETPLKSGIIKEMTGGDRFFARFLNENGGEITPMFTLNLFCNQIPIIPQCDQAIKNRVRVVPYLSTWQKNAPKSLDEQYKQRIFLMDTNFQAELPEMAPALLWWLVNEMYPKYKQEGTTEPIIVKKYTEEYWEDNDVYSQFVKENLEKAYEPEGCGKDQIDGKACITLQEMYGRFRDWHKENFQQLKTPDRQVVKNEIESRVTKCVQRKFYGIKFKVTVQDF